MANAEAELETIYRNLEQLLLSRASLDTLILPEAEEAYSSLKRAYEMGRIPYSTLLEGEQGLTEVGFELNDLHLAIRQESTALEQLLGISLRGITISQGRK